MSAARLVQPVLVKRYARSRVYGTANRRYVSIEQLREWAVIGVVFSVIDTKSRLTSREFS